MMCFPIRRSALSMIASGNILTILPTPLRAEQDQAADALRPVSISAALIGARLPHRAPAVALVSEISSPTFSAAELQKNPSRLDLSPDVAPISRCRWRFRLKKPLKG